jgi:hypothetical protein
MPALSPRAPDAPGLRQRKKQRDRYFKWAPPAMEVSIRFKYEKRDASGRIGTEVRTVAA